MFVIIHFRISRVPLLEAEFLGAYNMVNGETLPLQASRHCLKAYWQVVYVLDKVLELFVCLRMALTLSILIDHVSVSFLAVQT